MNLTVSEIMVGDMKMVADVAYVVRITALTVVLTKGVTATLLAIFMAAISLLSIITMLCTATCFTTDYVVQSTDKKTHAAVCAKI